MSVDVAALVDELDTALRTVGVADDVEPMQRYVKGQFRSWA